MAANFFNIRKGTNLQPVTGSTVSTQGDLAYNLSTNQLEVYTSAAEALTTASNTQTLTNKSLTSPSIASGTFTGSSTFPGSTSIDNTGTLVVGNNFTTNGGTNTLNSGGISPLILNTTATTGNTVSFKINGTENALIGLGGSGILSGSTDADTVLRNESGSTYFSSAGTKIVTITSAGNTTLKGNLIVSGTGTSTFAGALTTVDNTLDDGSGNVTLSAQISTPNLHNGGGTGTATSQAISSGTYTPTTSSSSNTTSISYGVSNWMRIGNVVTVGGTITATTSAIGGFAIFNVPVVGSTNFSSSGQLSGVAISQNTISAYGQISASSNKAQVSFTAAVTSYTYSYTFTYVVL